MPPTATFTLASGRSGTHYLYELIRWNTRDCVARHETYGLNPSLFGRPIYDYAVGDQTLTRHLLARKRRRVDRCGSARYVETSHAFLKSWFELAPEFFPWLKLIHLIRDPLKVAKSEAYREALIKRIRVPLCHYRGGDRQRYFLWSLTGREPIFQTLDSARLTRFQWYVVQWIEIENRAMQSLDKFDMQDRCLTLHSPNDLSDAERIAELFEFLELEWRHERLITSSRKNRNWRPTIIDDGDREQFIAVVRQIPSNYLEIFRREPYASLAGGDPQAGFRLLQRPPSPA